MFRFKRLLISMVLAFPLLQSCSINAPDWFTDMEKARQACANGDFDKADDWVEKSLNEAKVWTNGIPPKYLGRAPYSPSSLSGELATLAEYFSWWGKYNKSEEYFKEAISRSTQDDRMEYLEALGNFYTEQRDYKQAETLYAASLAYAETKYSGSERVAHHMQKLADCYMVQNKLTEAETLYGKEIDYLKKDSPDANAYELINALIAMGQCHIKQNRLPQANAEFEYALKIDSDNLKEVGCSVIISNLADLAIAQGDESKAEELYKKSLSKNKFSIAPEVQGVTRHNYAALLRRLGQVSEAQVVEGNHKDTPAEPPEAVDVKQKFRHFLPALYQ